MKDLKSLFDILLTSHEVADNDEKCHGYKPHRKDIEYKLSEEIRWNPVETACALVSEGLRPD